METMINWFHIRGLGALSALGLFLLYAVLAGWWQARKADGREKRAVEPNGPSPMNRRVPEHFNRRAA